MSGDDGSLPWVARAGQAERFKSGSVRGSGCNSPMPIWSPIRKVRILGRDRILKGRLARF